jgi:hypothetical protein
MIACFGKEKKKHKIVECTESNAHIYEDLKSQMSSGRTFDSLLPAILIT